MIPWDEDRFRLMCADLLHGLHEPTDGADADAEPRAHIIIARCPKCTCNFPVGVMVEEIPDAEGLN